MKLVLLSQLKEERKERTAFNQMPIQKEVNAAITNLKTRKDGKASKFGICYIGIVF